MTGVDAHGLLREQIAKLKHLHRNWGSEQLGDSVRLCSSEGTSYPCQTARALEGIEELVEAAIAAAEMKFADEVHVRHREALAVARRDALEQAADEVKRIRADGGIGPYARHFEDWLRVRAAEYDVSAVAPATPEAHT